MTDAAGTGTGRGLWQTTGRDAVVRLRRPAEEDRTLLAPLWQDARVTSFLGGPYDVEAARCLLDRHYRHWAEHGFGLRVVEDEDGRVLGLAGLTCADARGKPGADAEVSFYVYPHGWRQGYAAAALREVLHEGFTALDRPRLTAEVPLCHRRARALLERADFVMRTVRHDGGTTWCRYVLTRDAWASTTGRPSWVPSARNGVPDERLLAPLTPPARRRRGRA